MDRKIVKFPKVPVRNLSEINQAANDEGAERAEFKGKRALVIFSRAVRFMLFIVLYWLRLPIVNICSIVSVVMLFATLFAWYAFPDKSNMLWGFGVTSFTSFVIAWCYDFVLMKLSPMPMVDTL